MKCVLSVMKCNRFWKDRRGKKESSNNFVHPKKTKMDEIGISGIWIASLRDGVKIGWKVCCNLWSVFKDAQWMISFSECTYAYTTPNKSWESEHQLYASHMCLISLGTNGCWHLVTPQMLFLTKTPKREYSNFKKSSLDEIFYQLYHFWKEYVSISI